MPTSSFSRRSTTSCSANSGIPHGYYEILVRLSEAPDRTLRMSQLAERSQSSRSRISHAVARLEEGWVRRDTCATDRRGSMAVLTDKGLEALAAAAPGHVAGVRAHPFDRLSEEQVGQLQAISEAVRDHLLQFREDERAVGRCPPELPTVADAAAAPHDRGRAQAGACRRLTSHSPTTRAWSAAWPPGCRRPPLDLGPDEGDLDLEFALRHRKVPPAPSSRSSTVPVQCRRSG